MSEINNFPSQTRSFKQKGKKWRKQCMDWADSKTFFNYSLVRNSVMHKKINYDLVNGILHPSDMALVLNPDNVKAKYVPDNVQHYPIMNSKLNVLRGEESKRVFDFRVVVTNPTAISERENAKKEELMEKVQAAIADLAQSEEEFNQELEQIDDFYTYEWQDQREVRSNFLLNHYIKEYNMALMFNNGFMDACTVGEEIYQCDIVSGEPVISKLDPLKTRVFGSGYSNKIEDADMIIIEDYWSPGKIIDTFYDVLTDKDIKYIEELPHSQNADSMDNIDPRRGFIPNAGFESDLIDSGEFLFGADTTKEVMNSLMPYDLAGNIRVLRLYWKSRRKIKKVKSFNPETGEEEFNFYPETYEADTLMGEEEETLYINEAWEGTKIGEKIYVNMRPRPVQYNRLSNPSRCHFGIVGSIYNLNNAKPYSLVDMMKPYNYYYNVIHDRLNKAIAANWGSLVRMDLSKIPQDWTVDKWLYYAKVSHILVEDSFNEGQIGAATGKLAGAMNNASSGGVSLDTGNHIQQLINVLEYIKNEMSEVAGISKQREGQISNRETVGGVERATLQSSHITEWLFMIHDDVKKRTLECFLETAKIALRGRNKKFQYILPDSSIELVEIEGDQFAEADFGLVVDSSQGAQEFKAQLETLAQAALQNQSLRFSTITKLFSTSSLAEKQRIIEKGEEEMIQSSQEQQQAEQEMLQQKMEMEDAAAMRSLDYQDRINQRDNETRIEVAEIQARARIASMENYGEDSDDSLMKLKEDARQFNDKIKLAKEQLQHTRRIDNKEIDLKEKALKQRNTNTK